MCFITQLSSDGNPLVEKHGDFPQHIEHEHDTNSNQHDSGNDFNLTDVLTEPLERGQKLVKEEALEQERDTQPLGIDSKQENPFTDLTGRGCHHQN